MLERIVLAAVITFCAYLFLNFGSKPANTPTIDAKKEGNPGLIHRAISLSLQ